MQLDAAAVTWFVQAAFAELALFAAIGFIIGGIDELLVDGIWLVRSAWRQLTIYRSHGRTFAADLPHPPSTFRLAVFVPAWQEADVIGPMLRGALTAYERANVTIFVGCYPNDPVTIAAVRSITSDRIRLVTGPRPGPTTKADCLNAIWRQMIEGGEPFDAICLHDAEDVVSAFEAKVAAHLLPKFCLLQFPVVPLIQNKGRWVSGHYCDEFAEAHGKTMIVREALGAALPLAGVGCVLRMDAIAELAIGAPDGPFDPESLTEDYETGLRLGATDCPAAFVRMRERPGGPLVATRAYFPHSFRTAVRQKARWLIGIGITGWERMGWGTRWPERWMRFRDRQGLIAALVLCAGYAALFLSLMLLTAQNAGGPRLNIPPLVGSLLTATTVLMAWRLTVRAFFVGRVYGFKQASLSIPRTIVSNFIAVSRLREGSHDISR